MLKIEVSGENINFILIKKEGDLTTADSMAPVHWAVQYGEKWEELQPLDLDSTLKEEAKRAASGAEEALELDSILRNGACIGCDAWTVSLDTSRWAAASLPAPTVARLESTTAVNAKQKMS